jgi:hypothetical protein
MSREQVLAMNGHLGQALKLIETGAAANNAGIREHMKQFFSIAEEIEREIAKRKFLLFKKSKPTNFTQLGFSRNRLSRISSVSMYRLK